MKILWKNKILEIDKSVAYCDFCKVKIENSEAIHKQIWDSGQKFIITECCNCSKSLILYYNKFNQLDSEKAIKPKERNN